MKSSTTKNKNKIISISIWVFLWYILSMSIDNEILIPNPLGVLSTLFKLIRNNNTWVSILNSTLKIGFGYILGIFLGIILGSLSYRFTMLKNLIDVPMEFVKSVPIASIAILILIWFNSKKLPIIVVLLMVLPNIYYGTYQGLMNVDYRLLEMSKVFNVNKSKILKFIYIEELKTYLLPTLISTSGLAWKSGVSGEVLGLVSNSIGEKIYYSKLYLNTSELFAWTFIIIALSKLFLSIIKLLLKKVNQNE